MRGLFAKVKIIVIMWAIMIICPICMQVDTMLFLHVAVGWIDTWRTEKTSYGPF